MTDQPTPDVVNAIVRDMEDPRYPSRITVYCDRYGCDTRFTGEFMVSTTMTSEERLGVARQHLVDNEGWEHTGEGDDFCPTHASSPVVEQSAAAPRTNTLDVVTVDADGHKHTTVKLKRCCNGCGQYLGDADNRDVDERGNLTDVRGECAHCRPLVELEAQGCTTWEVTPRSISRVDDDLDRLGVFAKGYWEWDETRRKTVVVGLRVGSGESRVVARFGDWLIQHPDGTFTVHQAPASVETGE